MVSHRTQGATDGPHQRPTPTAHTDEPTVQPRGRYAPPTSASFAAKAGRGDYHDCVRLHYHLLAHHPKVFSFLYMKLQTTTKKLLNALLQAYINTHDLKNIYNDDGSKLITVNEAIKFVDKLTK